MKTKEQIINETVRYINKHGRALQKIDSHKTCMYRTDDNIGCAVGRCMDYRKYREDFEEQGLVSLLDNTLPEYGLTLDDILKKDYRGHEIEFWQDLQELHDSASYWQYNNKDLTDRGERAVKQLKEKWT